MGLGLGANVGVAQSSLVATENAVLVLVSGGTGGGSGGGGTCVASVGKDLLGMGFGLGADVGVPEERVALTIAEHQRGMD
jgi:hypothetical protein